MADEEKVKKILIEKFGIAEDKIILQRARRIFVEVPLARFMEIFPRVKPELGFYQLPAITGTDEGENFGVAYHFSREDGVVLTIKTFTPRSDPRIKTVTAYYPTATLYERELKDLLGIVVEGLAEGKRYPLPDDWPQGEYPLRKDWKPKPKSATSGVPESGAQEGEKKHE
jgi:membrane-bound hydrogenase subunit beta